MMNDRNGHNDGQRVATQVATPIESLAQPANFQPADEKTLGQLFVGMSEELSVLVRKEIELARVEMGEKVSQATTSIFKLVAGAILLHLGAIALLATGVIALGGAVAYWLAALLIGALVLIIGLVLVQNGRADLSSLNLIPAKSLSSLRNDTQMVTQMVKEKIQ